MLVLVLEWELMRRSYYQICHRDSQHNILGKKNVTRSYHLCMKISYVRKRRKSRRLCYAALGHGRGASSVNIISVRIVAALLPLREPLRATTS